MRGQQAKKKLPDGSITQQQKWRFLASLRLSLFPGTAECDLYQECRTKWKLVIVRQLDRQFRLQLGGHLASRKLYKELESSPVNSKKKICSEEMQRDSKRDLKNFNTTSRRSTRIFDSES